MQKKCIFVFAFLLSVILLSAQVKLADSPLPLDGNLMGDAWKSVPEQSGFQYLKASGKNTPPEVQTSFRVAADRDNLFVSILCREPNMKSLNISPSGPMWGSSVVELFLVPTGQTDEYYQFAVNPGNNRYAMFYGEAGLTRPDPYLPSWESKVFHAADYWLVQMRIPFSSLYMTRNEKWRSEWLLNVARSRSYSDLTSWSPLQDKFHEPANFRKFAGFPLRDPAQDVVIRKAIPLIRDFANGVYSGPLKMEIEANAAAAGAYDLTIEEPDGKSSTHAILLKRGENRLEIPQTEYIKKAQGKTELLLRLKSKKDGTVLERRYPVDIAWQPGRIHLDKPAYKNNFYPGQDFSEIRGEVILSIPDEQRKKTEVKITLSGDGLEKKELTVKAVMDKIPFSFDSSSLNEGGQAVLTAAIIRDERELQSVSRRITRLKRNEGSMIWIENGVIIKNGRPWYPRYIYAPGYGGGKAFALRFKADDLTESPFRHASLEPARLVPGIEQKEATKDIKPCPELFERIRRIVEKKKHDPDFDFYYISDEPEYRNVSPVYLKFIYDFVSELDPYHPLLSCTHEADKYVDCMDIFSVHPYLNPVITAGKRVLSIPVHKVRNYLRDLTRFGRPDKVIGFTGQFFSYKFNNVMADYPTWEELESMSWSAIANGSRFHFPYAYHDLGDRPWLYEGYRYFNQSIEALEKQLLSNNRLNVKAVDPENMIDTLLVEADGVMLLIVVNLKNEPLETVISSEHLKKIDSLLEFRGAGMRKLVNGELSLFLKPYECVILTSKKMDDGLDTRDQVLKKIAEADKARADHGSLLFEKGFTFEFDSSNPNGGILIPGYLGVRNKLFDGTRDVLAWTGTLSENNQWIELMFRKKPPKFTRIGIYGCFADSPSVKIWKKREWREILPKSQERTDFSCVLDFGEEISTVKIRMEFPCNKNAKPPELYEVELLK